MLASATTTKPVALCVDLDGTLIFSDMLQESILQYCKHSPWALFQIVWWFLHGRARLKDELARRVSIPVELLPYNQELIAFLKQRRASGQQIALVSASDQALVRKVAEHVGVFDEVHGSDGKTNLKSRNKLRFMRERFGAGGFSYVGDSVADRPIWRECVESFFVCRSGSLSGNGLKFTQVFHHPVRFKVWLKALRVHQWVKNLLVFVPMVLAHRWSDPADISAAFWAFLSLSLCASSVYVTNDLLDLESDRIHPRKRKRPFASGALPLSVGFTLAPMLLILGLMAARFPAPGFMWAVAAYIPTTLAYSLYLKRLMLVDILVLAGLYSLRLLAGAAAVNVPISEWTIAFAMFMFLSLAAVKRYSELVAMKKLDRNEAAGRGYRAIDLSQLAHLGTSAGYISVLVLALYVNSAEVVPLYRTPQLLWLLCPLILYWVSRVWFIAHRGELDDDPIVFALRDKSSYLVAALSLAVLLAAV